VSEMEEIKTLLGLTAAIIKVLEMGLVMEWYHMIKVFVHFRKTATEAFHFT
jgi:hypothetical protein